MDVSLCYVITVMFSNIYFKLNIEMFSVYYLNQNWLHHLIDYWAELFLAQVNINDI